MHTMKYKNKLEQPTPGVKLYSDEMTSLRNTADRAQIVDRVRKTLVVQRFVEAILYK